MNDLKAKISNLVEDIDSFSDNLRRKLRRINHAYDAITIIPYLGFGTHEKVRLSGRVLSDKGAVESQSGHSRWENLQNLYRRFATDEVAGARLRLRFQTIEREVITDDEGYFKAEIILDEKINNDALFQDVEIELVEPLLLENQTIRAIGQILIPPPSAQFGIISDLDDTVIVTNVTNRLKMFLTVALLNEHTRLPFKGVAAFYDALQKGFSGVDNNPIFYVSSSPWNLYAPLTEFLKIHNIPRGALFLKDFGNHTIFSSGEHQEHKLNSIETILETYPQMPFVLIGDSGEQDPEIYREVVRKYPNRIRAIYIRSINLESERLAAIDKLIAEIAETHCQLVLAPDTVNAAVHAAAEKLISTDTLSLIREEKIEEENALTAKEITEESNLTTE